MSWTSPNRPPRATQRRSPIQIAATMPRMIARAYPRIGSGPRCQTPCDGLGMDRRVKTSRLPKEGVDVLRELQGGGALAPVDRGLVVAVDPGDLRGVRVDVVAAGRQLVAHADRDRPGDRGDLVDVAGVVGHADEALVDVVEPPA